MKRKNIKLFGLLGLLVVLCFGYTGILLYKQNQEEKKEAQEEANKIYLTNTEGIKKISYNNRMEELSFIKKEETWYYEADETFPLNQSYLIELEEHLKKYEAERSLENGDTMEAYGLEEPSTIVTITDINDVETTIYFGNGTEEGYYACLENKEKAYVVDSTLYSDLQNGLYDMIVLETFPTLTEENLIEIQRTTEDSIRIYTKKENNIEKEKDNLGDNSKQQLKDNSKEQSEDNSEKQATDKVETDNELEDKELDNAELEDTTLENTQFEEKTYTWKVQENGIEEELEETFSDTILSGVMGLVNTSCVNYKVSAEELDSYGLTSPSLTIRVVYNEEEKEEEFTLYIGDIEESGSYYYTKIEGSNAVYFMSSELIDKLK